MRCFAILLVAALACASAEGQTQAKYLALRAKYKIHQAVDADALSSFVGERVVEVAGSVKGATKAQDGGVQYLMLESSGTPLFVQADKIEEWLLGGEQKVRLIIRAKRPSDGAEVRAVLLGAALDSDIAKVEAKEAARARPASRHKGRTVEWNLPISQVTPIYAGFINRHNPRLSSGEALRIAQGVVGFSIHFGVDARLIMALLIAESDLNPNGTSRVGAQGLGQLMPGTASAMGITNAYDTTQNLYGTVRLLRSHLDNYRRATGNDFASLVLALAAYNAGPGAVSRHGGVPPYRQTQAYVRKVVHIFRQLCGVE